ncbi:hypothetical protein C0J52_04391 [Blattella germanica]|nr:hypothetical protein C0J52_04391 [Blattella germanica]
MDCDSVNEHYMMVQHTPEEYVEMLIIIYGEAGHNGLVAQRMYYERFPHRPSPSHTIFVRIQQRLQEICIFILKKTCGAKQTRRTVDFEENPSTSTRKISDAMNVSQSTVITASPPTGADVFLGSALCWLSCVAVLTSLLFMMSASSEVITTTYHCKRCKAKAVDVLQCINCENCYHKSCATYAANVKILDDNKILCCETNTPIIQEKDNDIENDNSKGNDDVDEDFVKAVSNFSDDDNKIDMVIFKYIVKQKDLIIKALQAKIDTLEQFIVKQKDQMILVQQKKISILENCLEQNLSINEENIPLDKVSHQNIFTSNKISQTSKTLEASAANSNESAPCSSNQNHSDLHQIVNTNPEDSVIEDQEGGSMELGWTEVVRKNVNKQIGLKKTILI